MKLVNPVKTESKTHRKFLLLRRSDETGISGTGVVAHGVRFPAGKCAMCWDTNVSSVAVYDSLVDLIKIHGHGGKTRIVWMEPGHYDPTFFRRGRENAALDYCENAPYASIGGDIDNPAPYEDLMIPDDSLTEYLDGYLFGVVETQGGF